MAKQNIILPYVTVQEVLNFLRFCEAYGLFTPANIFSATEQVPEEPLTIGLEARKLRLLMIRLSEYDHF